MEHETRRTRLNLIGPPQPPSKEDFLSLLRENYGEILGLDRLGGEAELNYRVLTQTGARMLKVSREDACGFAQFQTHLMTFLGSRSNDLPLSRIVPTVSGAPSLVTDEGFGEVMQIRMSTFLQGIHPTGSHIDDRLRFEIASVLSRLNRELAVFNSALPDREMNWDISKAGRVMQSSSIDDLMMPRDRAELLFRTIERFDQDFLPQINSMEHQLIHNDFNPNNILVDPADNRVSGVIDFGDVLQLPRIVDLATAASYLVDPTSERRFSHSLQVLVSGWLKEDTLTTEEVRLIPEIMAARYALGLFLSSERASLHDDDDTYVTYVLRNAEGSWARLRMLLTIGTTATADAILADSIFQNLG